jgi:hypothetical protein
MLSTNKISVLSRYRDNSLERVANEIGARFGIYRDREQKMLAVGIMILQNRDKLALTDSRMVPADNGKIKWLLNT